MCILSNWLTSFWRESAADCISFIQKFVATQSAKPHSLCQTLLLQEVSSWRHASYKNFPDVYPARKKQTKSTDYINDWNTSQYVIL